MEYVLYDGELYHHGILGQRWGKRNGPPYPLMASKHSTSEKNAGWRKSLSKDSELAEKKQARKDAKREYDKAYSDWYNKSLSGLSPIKSHREADAARWDKAEATGNEYLKARNDYKALKTKLRQDRRAEIAEYEKNLPKDRFGLNSAQKKRLAEVTIGTAAVLGVGAAIYFGYKHGAINKMAELAEDGALTPDVAKKVMTQTLEDGDTVLTRGSVLHRMSAYANVDYSKATKPLYVSYKDADVASYMLLLKDWHKTGKRYDVTLEAMKDIRIPSKEKARALFEELWADDPEYKHQLQKTLVEAYKKLGASELYAKAQAAQDIGTDPFKAAMYSVVKGQEDTQKWIGLLQKHGYDAITDYFDAGVMADAPLIVFDPAGTLQKTGEQFVTRQLKLDTIEALKKAGIRKMPGTGISVGLLPLYV